MKFLIVDDDPCCRELLRELLSPYGDCDLAFDGNEAIDAVRLCLEDGQPYDLVCLDIMMPHRNGHQALEVIRQMEMERAIYGSAGVKVVMITALRDSKHCIWSFREGCESYYTKPIRGEDFLDCVRRLLGDLREAAQTPPDAAVAPRLAGPQSAGPQSAGPREGKSTTPLADVRRHPDRSGEDRYLIVDDDRICRELLHAMLSDYGECTLARDGREGVEAVRSALEKNRPFDLIMLDIMMPGMDGHQVLTTIRALEVERGIYGSDGAKVIMTTALCDSKHCIRSFREGCECYITKPVNEAELLDRICQLGLLVPC